MRTKTFIAISLTFCLLLLPLTALAKKGEKNFKRGMDYEAAQQWDKAAQEYTLAVAADPSNMEYQLHFRRASFNASQSFMQQGRSLAEHGDFVGAYNAFRQAYGYDAVNELAVSEMERMLRMQAVKEGKVHPDGIKAPETQQDATFTPISTQAAPQDLNVPRTEQLRVITYNGDLKAFIRSLAEQLNLNVIFDRTSFSQSRNVDINLRDVTTAQALDYIFLQEGLFFQKLSRRTILVADQSRRPQYQQLVLRTFFLSNMKPTDARQLVQQAIPPSVGRPQTIVVPDDATNSLTVRDTAENVRLIGDLLQSIDKDRAEVVMDVGIYEVSKSDLLQFGNQVGAGDFNLGGSPGIAYLSNAGVPNGGSAGVNLSQIIGGSPTALAAALILPSSVFHALQDKSNTKLVASTQVHAFNGEESTARIGQRVPVQTAQAYPFGVQTGTPPTGSQFPTGGFPVINYEPTGLTLKFTPQVFPNLDVQVKMNIEQKDVLGANSLTPTFTERTMTGTARVQNNRTMMLASVSTDVETRGRRGIAFIGGLPIIGRLFTSPTRDLRTVDIVIAVTPRVLRAPAVTPRDLEMRPSGTLQSPTTGSLEAMIREADHDEQIAAARVIPRITNVQLPDAPVQMAAPTNTVAQNQAQQRPAVVTPASVQTGNGNSFAATQTTAVATQPQVTQPAKAASSPEDLPSFVPAPKSLVSDQAATQVAAVNPSAAGTQNAVLSSQPKPTETSLNTTSGSRVARLSFMSGDDTMKIGEKRRFALQLDSELSLSMALMALRFDPKVLKVSAISAGTLLSQTDVVPALTQSIDPSGVCMISISALNGKLAMKGSGVLIFVDVEAVGPGVASLIFDPQSLHLVATDARDVVSEVTPGSAVVKQ
jgi:general secretion pathway protein D